jgi:prepilin-type N-terminal cleavage/methylation domain-containing protein
MKKGFTLIELIATIIIIGLLATITTPIIITTIHNEE